MKKRILKFSVLPIVAAFLLFSFSSKDRRTIDIEFLSSNLPEHYRVPLKIHSVQQGKLPKLGNGFVGFKEAVGFKESQGNYEVINQFGYMGKYQFGRGTLEMIGIYNTQKFLNSPALQEAAFYANCARNKWILRQEIKRYVGDTIGGIKITESGILAAAHLAGPGGVQTFLRSGGALYFSDAFGTTVKNYLNKFKGYDTSIVEANRRAEAHI